jgi:hypothetical protein
MVRTSELAKDAELQLPRGSRIARLALLGFLLISAAGALLRIHQAVTRVSRDRLLEFLWGFAALQIGMAIVDAAALFGIERRRPAGYYAGAGAIAIHVALIHYGRMYHPAVVSTTRTEAFGADVTIWLLTLGFVWVISVLVRGGGVESQRGRRPQEAA